MPKGAADWPGQARRETSGLKAPPGAKAKGQALGTPKRLCTAKKAENCLSDRVAGTETPGAHLLKA